LALIPDLRKTSVLGANGVIQLERTIYRELLLGATRAHNADKLLKVWHDFPKSLLTDLDLVFIYVNGLIDYGKFFEAESVLKQTLKKHWSEALVGLYGLVKSANVGKQLATAEGWLKHHSDSADLFLSLGRLCLYNQLWGKAQRYFEASISLKGSPDAYAELGRLCDQMEKPELSAQYYRKGLMLTAPSVGSDNSGNSLQGNILIESS